MRVKDLLTGAPIIFGWLKGTRTTVAVSGTATEVLWTKTVTGTSNRSKRLRVVIRGATTADGTVATGHKQVYREYSIVYKKSGSNNLSGHAHAFIKNVALYSGSHTFNDDATAQFGDMGLNTGTGVMQIRFTGLSGDTWAFTIDEYIEDF